MNTIPSIVEPSRISWRAILAGAVVALSIHLLLTTLGGGITALVARPSANDAPAKTLAIGTAVAWSLSALISLWVGGCVAGKVAAPGDAESGKIHGFVMWSAATVITFLLLVAGIGGAVTGAANIAGSTLAIAGKAAVEAAPDLAGQANKMIDGYTGEITAGGQPLTPAAKRELAFSLRNLLTGGDEARPANRDAVIKVLTTSAGMTPEDAARTVDEWLRSYDRTRDELKAAADAAAAKAREIADRAAVATGVAAIWTFVAFWLGAAVSVWGGRCGALGCVTRTDKVVPRQAPVMG